MFVESERSQSLEFVLVFQVLQTERPPIAHRPPFSASANGEVSSDASCVITDQRTTRDGCDDKWKFEFLSLAIYVSGEADCDCIFNELTESGEITMPLGPTFRSPRYACSKINLGFTGWSWSLAKVHQRPDEIDKWLSISALSPRRPGMALVEQRPSEWRSSRCCRSLRRNVRVPDDEPRSGSGWLRSE